MGSFEPLYDLDTQMLSVSLVHHGSSIPLAPLDKRTALSPELLMEAIESYIDSAETKIELLGYSMGGRIALTLFERFPEKFSRVIVLATDGLKMGKLYKFVVNTKLGKITWGLIDKFPNSEYAKEAKNRLVTLRNSLARHELFVAIYYTKKTANIAAINRAKFIIEQYPNTPSVPAALHLMAHNYDIIKADKLAADTRRVLQTSYPQYIVHYSLED